MIPHPNYPHLICSDDEQAVQTTVLVAALRGDSDARAALASLQSCFEEPYRTIAAELNEQCCSGNYTDEHTVRAALEGKPLIHLRADGTVQQLTPAQAISLVCACGQPVPGQVSAYLTILRQRLESHRRDQRRERLEELVRTYGDDPRRLLAEVERFASEPVGHAGIPTELMQFFPYVERLVAHQEGTDFRGLDSGFRVLNQVIDGLVPGLSVWAAKPSAGKTTFCWQVCQQVATLNKVPVVFVSMEQAADDLRTKTMARLSGLNVTHIGRGRLRSDDSDQMNRLLMAASQYCTPARYLTIIEGDDTTDVDQICEVVSKQMTAARSDRSLVVVDYLQILPTRPADVHRVNSAKDRVDLHVSGLRRMARQLNSHVMAISSENRQGYKSKQLDVFKESGGIEYSADVAVVMTQDTESTASTDRDYRVVDVNIIKNRNGSQARINFKFYPKQAKFVEQRREELSEEDD